MSEITLSYQKPTVKNPHGQFDAEDLSLRRAGGARIRATAAPSSADEADMSAARRLARQRLMGKLADLQVPLAETFVGTGKSPTVEWAEAKGTREASEGGDMNQGERALVLRYSGGQGEAEKPLGGGRIDLWIHDWIIEAKSSASRSAVDSVVGQILRRIRDAEFVLEFEATAALFPARPSDDSVEFLHENGIIVIWETTAGGFEREDA